MSATIIRYRDATSVSDFVYLRAEVIYDKDAGTLAVGDGVTVYSALPKFGIATVLAWGAIIGDLADQTDLQAALDAKEDGWSYVTLGSDFTTTSATAVDVTGMEFTPAASTKYEFEIMLLLRTATGTVGPQPGLAWPTGLTDGVVRMFASSAVNAEVIRHGNSSAAVLVPNTGMSSTTTSYMGGGEGFVIAGGSPSGTVKVQLASETAGTTVTIKAGSFLRWRIIP